MPKVLVCYKWVLDESDIRINPDLSVDFSKAKYKISDYDKHTIEAGSQAAKALGGTCTGISCGGAETRKSFNDALARGMDEGIWVNTAESRTAGRLPDGRSARCRRRHRGGRSAAAVQRGLQRRLRQADRPPARRHPRLARPEQRDLLQRRGRRRHRRAQA